MYAYTLVHCDIGYAVTFLARFASHPSKAHYHALKHLARYLRATKDWGIVYRRGKPLSDFPEVALPKLQESDNLPEFSHSQELCAYVNAVHAMDLKTRRLVTGLFINLGSGAVAYKCKLQPTVVTSSTKAEFLEVAFAAKMVLCI